MTWFGRRVARRRLHEEARDVARFLALAEFLM
jgi:hypothetical protein